MGVEIEKKFIVTKEKADFFNQKTINGELDYHEIEQAYLTTDPVIRVRRSDDEYYMTYKGKGLLEREEYNLPLTKAAYDTLCSKADGNIIKKKRILIPYENHTIELDIFDKPFDNIIMAEVEFDSLEDANDFIPPEWFMQEVTNNPEYQNSRMSRKVFK